MFEALKAPPPEPAWVPRVFYRLWCMIGTAGVLVGFLRDGTSRPFDLVCNAAVCVLAVYFFVTGRTSKPTQRGISIRFTVLLLLALLPTIVRGV